MLNNYNLRSVTEQCDPSKQKNQAKNQAKNTSDPAE